jgi:L-rhamnose mutarotase
LFLALKAKDLIIIISFLFTDNFLIERQKMRRNAFKMKLSSGNVVEYKRRHDKIWPELVEELRKAGVSDYSIFYDDQTQILFAFQKLTDDNTSEYLPENPIVRKWWDYMNDGIMECNEKGEPVSIPLTEVFHMD